MYESPLNLIYQDIERQIVQKQEQTILNAISKCDVVVDKEELIKAINYDRNQYSKGYKDGVSDVLDKLKEDIKNIRDNPLYNMVSRDTILEIVLEKIDMLAESEDKK